MKTRYQSLDTLRAIAVFLVFSRHVDPYDGTNPFVSVITSFFFRGGWTGVDLFFVLSGFLIAGLLFKEHKRFGSISFKHFFIRRGFKIYPSFYAMILMTPMLFIGYNRNISNLKTVLLHSIPYLFYFQDYISNEFIFFWGHTWSLAIEEQFYILLPILLILLTKIKKNGEDSFRLIPVIFFFLGTVCLLARIVNAAVKTPFTIITHLYPFHLRIDSLFFGVFISYLYHYHSVTLLEIAKRFRYFLLCAGLILFVPEFLLGIEGTPFIYTFGFTFLYVGSGLIIMAVVEDKPSENFLMKTAAYIGSHSYSIYLWHFPIRWLIYERISHSIGARFNWFYATAFFFITSIVFGIFMSNLIEFPLLKLRDRLYPTRST